jgi:two-component system, OmpR family, response regulator
MKTNAARSATPQQTVFLVDDSDVVREHLAQLVRSVPGARVVGEADMAFDAIYAIRRLKPSVVVLDIAMPGGSGIEVLEAIRREAHRPTVIMLTNFSQDRHRERCLELGADHFLDKLSQIDRLPEVIAQLGELTEVAA